MLAKLKVCYWLLFYRRFVLFTSAVVLFSLFPCLCMKQGSSSYVFTVISTELDRVSKTLALHNFAGYEAKSTS